MTRVRSNIALREEQMAKGTMGPPSCRDRFTRDGEGKIRRGRESLSSRGDAFRLSSIPVAKVNRTSRAKSSKFWSNGTADQGNGTWLLARRAGDTQSGHCGLSTRP